MLQRIPEIAAKFGTELDWLADRIARNRERAGMHYRSDSVAGKALAEYLEGTIINNAVAAVPNHFAASNPVIPPATLILTDAQIDAVRAAAVAAGATIMPELRNVIENAKVEWSTVVTTP
jgi:hypothetical protein